MTENATETIAEPQKFEIKKSHRMNFTRKSVKLQRQVDDFQLKKKRLSLQELKLSEKHLNRSCLLRIQKQIKAQKTLTTLRVYQEDWQMKYLDSFVLKTKVLEISRCLKHLLSLNNKMFHFPKQATEDIDIAKLCKFIFSFRYLQEISLCLESCPSITDKGVQKINSVLKYSYHLLFLGLRFHDCDSISEEGWKSLWKTSSFLKKIQTFKLLCSECRITDIGLESLSEKLHVLKSLQAVSLSISDLFGVADYGLNKLTKALSSLPSLKSLNLDFKNQRGFTNYGFSFLPQHFQALGSLQGLGFNFQNCTGIKEEGWVDLCQTVSLCPLLQYFSLIIGNPSLDTDKVTDHVLTSLSQSFRDLGSLKILRIDFRRCVEISDRGLISLSKAIKNCSLLQNVELYFTGCKKLSDIGVISLFDALECFSSQLHFKVHMVMCPKISSTLRLQLIQQWTHSQNPSARRNLVNL